MNKLVPRQVYGPQLLVSLEHPQELEPRKRLQVVPAKVNFLDATIVRQKLTDVCHTPLTEVNAH